MRKTRSQTLAEQQISNQDYRFLNHDQGEEEKSDGKGQGIVEVNHESEEPMIFRKINFITNDMGDLLIGELLNQLIKSKKSQFIAQSIVSYFSNAEHCYIFLGAYPFSPELVIPAMEFPVQNNKLKLKSRVKSTPIAGTGSDLFFVDSACQNSLSKGSRRTKERKIGQIIEKVAEWRALYTGNRRQQGYRGNKISLEQSANRVGISKKSLDDYLLQIRFGKKYGFNFNEHKDDKVGILRSFVRKEKEMERAKQKGLSKRLSSRLSSAYSSVNVNKTKRLKLKIQSLDKFQHLKWRSNFTFNFKNDASRRVDDEEVPEYIIE